MADGRSRRMLCLGVKMLPLPCTIPFHFHAIARSASALPVAVVLAGGLVASGGRTDGLAVAGRRTEGAPLALALARPWPPAPSCHSHSRSRFLACLAAAAAPLPPPPPNRTFRCCRIGICMSACGFALATLIILSI